MTFAIYIVFLCQLIGDFLKLSSILSTKCLATINLMVNCFYLFIYNNAILPTDINIYLNSLDVCKLF